MRFIVDAQLPPALAEWLRSAGHEADAVRDIGLRDAPDAAIWAAAAAAGAVLITKDEDFARMAASGADGPALLWIRSGNLLKRALLAQIALAWPEIQRHLADGSRLVELR